MTENTAAKDQTFTQNVGIHLILTCVIGLLFAANSFTGMMASELIYPTADLYNSFLPNDYINLFFGVPILILSAVLLSKKTGIGFAGFAASLMYILYNSIAYLFAVRNAISMSINALAVLLCGIGLVSAAISFSRKPVTLTSAVRRPRLYGGILAGIGLVFVARALVNIVSLAAGNAELPLPDIGVNIADIVICACWIISGGLLIFNKSKFGLPSAWISYLHGSMLFLSLIAFLIIQPLLCETEFASEDVIVIGTMSLILIIPCILLTRRISRKQN
jgi:hypothetical protein